MSRRRNPRAVIGALIVSAVVAGSYKLYAYYTQEKQPVNETKHNNKQKQYTNRSIALTLSHSILNSQLPLNELLLTSENVTFILPPNLSIDDLAYNIYNEQDKQESYNLPKTLIKNYKLLNCSNFQGYFNVLKNLKPDTLVLCPDDLGIANQLPKDLHRFVKEIINIENSEDISSKVLPLFLN